MNPAPDLPRPYASPGPTMASDDAVAGRYLHEAVTSMDDGFFVVDREWRYVYVNPAGCEMIGRPFEEVRGISQWEVNPGLLGSVFEQEYRRAMVSRRTTRFEALYEPYGTWFKIHAYPSGDHLAVIARDVTAQKRAQTLLIESEARHRAIVQAIPDLLLWIDEEGWVLNADTEQYISHPLCHACEVTGEDGVLRCHIDNIFPSGTAERVSDAARRVMQSQQPGHIDFQYSDESREMRFFEGRVVPIDAGAALMVVQDVTERRRLEGQILEVSEDVRQHIGRDLHDGLGSHLTGVAMIARRIARDIRRGLPVAAASVDEIAELIAEGNEQARRLARGLNPVVIERDGLCAALTTLTRSLQQLGGPECTLGSLPRGDGCGDTEHPHCPTGFPELDVHVATHLYRIAQEAAHNSLRHAGAAEIRIDLEHREGNVLLTVADDGVGFDPTARTGMGISVMRYRARLIGASLEIRRRQPRGTLVSCERPISTTPTILPITLNDEMPRLCCG